MFLSDNYSATLAVDTFVDSSAPKLSNPLIGGIPGWSQWSGLNRRPTVYETVALPLSYIGLRKPIIIRRNRLVASPFAVFAGPGHFQCDLISDNLPCRPCKLFEYAEFVRSDSHESGLQQALDRRFPVRRIHLRRQRGETRELDGYGLSHARRHWREDVAYDRWRLQS